MDGWFQSAKRENTSESETKNREDNLKHVHPNGSNDHVLEDEQAFPHCHASTRRDWENGNICGPVAGLHEEER